MKTSCATCDYYSNYNATCTKHNTNLSWLAIHECNILCKDHSNPKLNILEDISCRNCKHFQKGAFHVCKRNGITILPASSTDLIQCPMVEMVNS